MRVLTSTVVLLVMLASVAIAQPPDRLDAYNVLPRFSTFTQTGGVAGTRSEYRLTGEYDFAQEWSGGRPDEPLELSARFVEPDLRAELGPMLPAFIDVDDLLNMENLRGQLVPQPLAFTPFEIFKFEGVASDSPAASPLEQSLVELYAVTFGPWMYLRGETTPRPWSSDGFEYELRALARSGDWSDWNADGVVDAADYTLLRDEAARGASSNAIMSDRLSSWRAEFGAVAPDLATFDLAIDAAVAPQAGVATPEPTALVLVAVAAATLGLRSRPCGCRP